MIIGHDNRSPTQPTGRGRSRRRLGFCAVMSTIRIAALLLAVAALRAATAHADVTPPSPTMSTATATTATTSTAATTTTTATNTTTATTSRAPAKPCWHRVVSRIALGRPIEIDVFYYGLKKHTIVDTGFFIALAVQKPGSTTWTHVSWEAPVITALHGGWKWETVYHSPAKVARGTYRLTVYPETPYGNGRGGSCQAAPVSRFIPVR